MVYTGPVVYRLLLFGLSFSSRAFLSKELQFPAKTNADQHPYCLILN